MSLRGRPLWLPRNPRLRGSESGVTPKCTAATFLCPGLPLLLSDLSPPAGRWGSGRLTLTAPVFKTKPEASLSPAGPRKGFQVQKSWWRGGRLRVVSVSLLWRCPAEGRTAGSSRVGLRAAPHPSPCSPPPAPGDPFRGLGQREHGQDMEGGRA